jgi:fructose-bisphosphate aldolase class I
VSFSYQKLKECGVLLEGTLLKPSMMVAGIDCPEKPTPADVAAQTSITK